MALEVEIDVGNVSNWIDTHLERRKGEGNRLREALGVEELERLQKLARENKTSPEFLEKQREKDRYRRRCERDGDPIDEELVPGFYSRTRSEGAFRIAWGNDPGNSGTSRLVAWNQDQPIWTCSINLRVVACWLARTTGDSVAQVEIKDQEGRDERCRRSLFIVFSPLGAIREHFQFREQVDRFLGIDETGENYVWSRAGKTSLSALGTHEEWFRWHAEGLGYVGCGRFESEHQRVRLHSHGGSVLELCWEDEYSAPIAALRRELDRMNHPSERLRAIRAEWELIAVDVQRESKASEFLSLLDMISVEELRVNSWYGLGPLDLLRCRVDILEDLGDPQATADARELLSGWETAIVFPQIAVSAVKEAVAAGDSTALEGFEAKLAQCLSNRTLQSDPEMLARVWRALGHLEESRGNLPRALEHFNTAIELWGEVGCVRDAQRLEKIIRQS